MKSIAQEAEEQLDALLRRYDREPPREAILQLFLLALEREEVVSIGYRESLIAARLRRMPVDYQSKDLIRRALIWAWQDEEMHALFSRGAILKLGNKRLRAHALVRQTAGIIGGWSAAALQHTKWTQAPLSRALASLATTIAALTGRLPKEVRQHLKLRPFRELCLFNAELEAASQLSWQRIVECTQHSTEFSDKEVNDFRRVVQDEERHRRIFTLLADSLDQSDQLVPGASPNRLAAQIAEIGEFYLPRKLRRCRYLENPLGGGGQTACIAGNSPQEKFSVLREALQKSNFAEQFAARARHIGKSISEMRVTIKAAFMLGYNRRDPSPVLDPELLHELAKYLRELGCSKLTVLEAPSIYDRFYNNRSVAVVADYCGIPSSLFRLVDASADRVTHQYIRGMALYSVARCWKEADFRISFGKLRSHPTENVLLTIANLEGLGGRLDEYIFFERQATRATSLMMLLDEFPPHFALLDAFQNCPDGMVGMMGCRRPQNPLRIYAGADALAVDLLAASHVGLSDPGESGLLQSAHHWFGGWPEEVKKIGIDAAIQNWRGPYSNELWALMSFFALPMYVFGSGRGLRFVPEMDLSAFPPVQPENGFLKFRRRNIRALLGLRLPRNS